MSAVNPNNPGILPVMLSSLAIGIDNLNKEISTLKREQVAMLNQFKREVHQTSDVLKKNDELIDRNGKLMDKLLNEEPKPTVVKKAEVIDIKSAKVENPKVVKEDRETSVFTRGVKIIAALACIILVAATIFGGFGLVVPCVTLFTTGAVVGLSVLAMDVT